ncbi:MAG: BRCT domain-containing protein [Phycisphaerae bacterium]
MARVVQRRTSPPYLLIMFVFLFLIAAALAVMFYLQADSKAKALAEAETKYVQVVKQADLGDPMIKALLEKSSKLPTGESVVSQLKNEVDTLASKIAPLGRTYDAAMAEFNDAYESEQAEKKAAEDAKRPEVPIYTGQSLSQLVTESRDKVLAAMKRYDEANAKAIKLEEEKTTLAKDKDAEISKLKDELGKTETKVNDVTKELTAEQEKYQKLIGEKNKEMEATTARQQAQITAENAKYEAMRQDRDVWKKRAEEFQKSIIPTKTGVAPTPLAAGKIEKILDAEKLCYINLGTKENVRPGMTFSVYPFTGIPEGGTPVKAKIRIANVGDMYSECTILEEDPRNPLAVGDLIANVAYDKARQFKFVVEGVFDLRGTGRPDALGADEIRDMIKRAGATVEDKLTYQTDYLVLGDPPPRPPKPPEGANPSADKLYQEAEKAYQRYVDVENQAKALGIPVLNTNRFLAEIGYSAPKTTGK